MSQFPFQFPVEPDPERLEEIRQAQHRQEIAELDFRHGVQRMIEELTEEQLTLWRALLGHISDAEHSHDAPVPLTNILYGQISWELKKRFNICASCGVNHDTEIAPEPEQPNLNEVPDTPNTEPDMPEGAYGQRPDGVFSWSKLAVRDMAVYHLDDQYAWNEDESWATFQGFVCTGIEGTTGPCGVVYPSLADRKLKGPEECSGCFQRMMHG